MGLVDEMSELTDLEAFVALYRRFGIECLVNKRPDHDCQVIIIGDRDPMFSGDPDWTFVEGKIEGYNNFYTAISFDLEGKFIRQGIWE